MHEWAYWPFGPGITGSWLNMAVKFIFIGILFAVIIGFIRFLFGPGGWLREKEWDECGGRKDDGIEESLGILRRRLAAGEITPEEFEEKKRLIKK